MRRYVAPAFLACLLSTTLVGQCSNVTQPFGSGCGLFTPFGIPVLTCVGTPTVGNLGFGLLTTAPCVSNASLLLLGPCLPAPVVITSGFGPGGICGPSQATCMLSLDPGLILIGTPTAGGYTFSTPIPNDAGLVGLRLCAQGAPLCTALPCIAASQGISVTVQ